MQNPNKTLRPLFTTFAERYATRPGGYTRLNRAGFRVGDRAAIAVLSLVDSSKDLKFEHAAAAVGRELAVRARTDDGPGPAGWWSFRSRVEAASPAAQLDTLARAFGESVSYVTLSLTVYLIFQACAPSFVAPLSDSFGRRPVIVACIAGYVAACIGLATVPTTTFGGFLGLRVMQAIFGSPLIAIGAGVVADIATTKERGKFMGLYSGVAMFGPAFGPTLGGIFNQTLGWLVSRSPF